MTRPKRWPNRQMANRDNTADELIAIYRLSERLYDMAEKGVFTRTELRLLAEKLKSRSLKGMMHMKDAGADIDMNML